MLRPRQSIPVIIDYSRESWFFDEPLPQEMTRSQPIYVYSDRLVYALWFVTSLPDEWRGEAVYSFIEHMDELERIAV